MRKECGVAEKDKQCIRSFRKARNIPSPDQHTSNPDLRPPDLPPLLASSRLPL